MAEADLSFDPLTFPACWAVARYLTVPELLRIGQCGKRLNAVVKSGMHDSWRDVCLRRFRPHVGPKILKSIDTDWYQRLQQYHKENLMPRGRFSARHNPVMGTALVHRADSSLAARLWLTVVSRENSRLLHRSMSEISAESGSAGTAGQNGTSEVVAAPERPVLGAESTAGSTAGTGSSDVADPGAATVSLIRHPPGCLCCGGGLVTQRAFGVPIAGTAVGGAWDAVTSDLPADAFDLLPPRPPGPPVTSRSVAAGGGGGSTTASAAGSRRASRRGGGLAVNPMTGATGLVLGDELEGGTEDQPEGQLEDQLGGGLEDQLEGGIEDWLGGGLGEPGEWGSRGGWGTAPPTRSGDAASAGSLPVAALPAAGAPPQLAPGAASTATPGADGGGAAAVGGDAGVIARSTSGASSGAAVGGDAGVIARSTSGASSRSDPREPLDRWLEVRVVVQHPGGCHALLVSAVNARAELATGETRPMVPLRMAPVVALNGEKPEEPLTSCVLRSYEYCVVQLCIPFKASEATREPFALELVRAVTLYGARADGVGRGLTMRVEGAGAGVWKHYMFMPGDFIAFRPSM